MRNNLIYICLFALLITGCVQKTYQKTVVFELDVSQVKNIETVGTGYKFTEVKFTVNDEFELKGKDNRRINFSEKDTTYYKAFFDKVEQ